MTGNLFPIKVTEKSIMFGIKQALSFKGWRVVRMPPPIYAGKGLPDLYAVRNGISVWIEVKTMTGKLSREQAEFGRRISDAGGLYIVARSVEYAVECCDRIVISNGGSAIVPGKGMKLSIDGKEGYGKGSF
jgi:hypothetical protein